MICCCISGVFLTPDDEEDAGMMLGNSPSVAEEICFFCTVKLKSLQVIRELSSVEEGKREFTSRHSMEWKFLFLDHRCENLRFPFHFYMKKKTQGKGVKGETNSVLH